MTISLATEKNTRRGPIDHRKTLWIGAKGSDIAASALVWNGLRPREIRVLTAGNLNVTYDDGTTEIITSIPAGTVFTDNCWVSISATSSTAFNLSFGW